MQQLCKYIAKVALPFFLGVTILWIVPAWGDDKDKDVETLKNAATVLDAMLNSNTVPVDVLANAKCIAVLPDVKKIGFGIGGSGGRGPLSCREGSSFKGKWSPPAMYSVGGVSAGFQVGTSSTDFVLLVMNEKAVDAIKKGKIKLGKDATAVAGPSASASAAGVSGSDIYTYGRAKGLFAGVSLGSAGLEPDTDANKRLYGTDISAAAIVGANRVVKPPEGAEPLLSLLDSKVGK